MSDNSNTHPEGQEPNGGNNEPTATSNEEVNEQEGAGAEAPVEPSLWEGIPEEHPVRAEVANLRREAAAKRTSAQQVKQENEQLQQSLKGAKTSEEVEQLIQDWQGKVSQAELAATRERVGRRHKLPDEFVELLKGETEEDLDEHGQTLKGLLGSSGNGAPPPEPPRGGRSPNDATPDPKQNLSAIKASRR